MKKAIVSLLLTFLAAFGYVAVDKATDDRLSALEEIVSSQNAVLATVHGTTDLQIGDKISCINLSCPLEWHHNNGAVSVITKCDIEVIRKQTLEELALSTDASLPQPTALEIEGSNSIEVKAQDDNPTVPISPSTTMPPTTLTMPSPTYAYIPDNTRKYGPYTYKFTVEGKTDIKYINHRIDAVFNVITLSGTIQSDGTFYLTATAPMSGDENVLLNNLKMFVLSDHTSIY